MLEKPAEPRRLYQQIAEQIRALIQTGKFASGTRLPSERELAIQLGVSRPSLREGLIALELEGLVEIRVGSGVYVLAERPSASAVGPHMGDSPSELMQARAVLEGTVAILAAARMSEDALVLLDNILLEMEREIRAGRNPVDQDRAFHMIIAGQCGNSVLERLVAGLFDDRHSPMAARLQDRFGSPETWLLALREHRDVYLALVRRDVLLAQASMHAHLEASRLRWVEY